MSLSTIILKNNTISDIKLISLGSMIVPSSGQLDISDFAYVNEVQNSKEIVDYVINGSLLINNGSETLTTDESLGYLTPMTVVSESNPNLDIENSTLHRLDVLTNPHNVTKTQVGLSNVTNDSQLKRSAGDFNTFTELSSSNVASNDIMLIEDAHDSYNKKKVTILNAVLGGLASNYAESRDTSSTTETVTWQTKLSLTVTSAFDNAVFRVGFSSEFNSSANNKAVLLRVYNSTDALVRAETNQQTNAATNWFGFSGFFYVNFTTAGSKVYNIQYLSTAGTTCSIRNAVIEDRRVS